MVGCRGNYFVSHFGLLCMGDLVMTVIGLQDKLDRLVVERNIRETKPTN